MVISQNIHRLWMSTLVLTLMLILALALMLVANSANAALTASVDRTTIAKNDIIQLTIRSDKGPIEHTDFSALEQYFSVINRQRSNQISIINGQQTAIYDLRLALFPINAGRFTIPAFSSRGESSQPIQITVTESPAAASQEHQEVFLKTLISKQQAYVQEPLLLTVQLFHAVGLREAQLSSLDVEGAVIDELGDQSKGEKILNGVRYSVIEKQYSITPEKSGRLNIPALTFTGRTNYRGVYAEPSQYVRTRSTAHEVDVLPKPDNYPAHAPWLPTSALSISDSWDANPPTLTVGESVTRTLTLSALNLNAAQLPDLALPSVPTLKLYPDQSRNENTATKSGILGQRIFSTAIVATQAGQIKIPEQKIIWWNTDSKQLEQAIIPAVVLNVKAAAHPGKQSASPSFTHPTEPPQRQNGQTETSNTETSAIENSAETSAGFWPYLSVLFALLWLATLVLWWWFANRTKSNPVERLIEPLNSQQQSARSAFKNVKKSCRDNNATDARQALISWFKINYPQQQATGLKDISNYYQDAELNELIAQMERCLYSEKTSQWRGETLLKHIEKLEKKQHQQTKNRDKNKLKPLYPF